MRWIRWIAAAVVLILLAAVLGLPRLNEFEREGRLVLPGLKGEVRVVRDELGEELARAMLGNWYFWQERLQRMVLEGGSPWFDDQGTPVKEGRDELFLRAALAVITEAKSGGVGEHEAEV